MLLYGCWAVSEQPAVCVWNLRMADFGFLQWNLSVITLYQIFRAARYFATSSKRSLCALKKNDRRGAKSSTSRPWSMPHLTYSMPFARVKASSWAAVAPASRMWYPLIEIVFHCGTCAEPNSNVSTTSRIEGSGGKIHSFCAWYSFRMSFWIVPRSVDQDAPRSSAIARYIAQMALAGELIVIDVLTSPTSIPSNRIFMSSRDETATPHVPNSPFASASSVSYPYSVG